MRNTFKNTKKRGFFIALSKRSKHQNNYILLVNRLSCIFSAIYKTCLCSICYENYIIWTKKGKRRKMVFRGIMSRNWLSELRKCATDGTFHPHRKGKKRGVKGRLKGQKGLYFQNYIDVFTRIAVHKTR